MRPPPSATTSSTRDDDGPARRMSPFIVSDGKELPSLGVAAALRAGGFRRKTVGPDGERAAHRRPPHSAGHAPRRRSRSVVDADQLPGAGAGEECRRRARDALPVVRVPSSSSRAEQEILEGKKPRLDPAVFKDKIVFIGLTASGLLDVFGTPMSNEQNRVDARHPAARQHGRQHPGEPVHPAAPRALARSARS